MENIIDLIKNLIRTFYGWLKQDRSAWSIKEIIFILYHKRLSVFYESIQSLNSSTIRWEVLHLITTVNNNYFSVSQLICHLRFDYVVLTLHQPMQVSSLWFDLFNYVLQILGFRHPIWCDLEMFLIGQICATIHFIWDLNNLSFKHQIPNCGKVLMEMFKKNS